LSTLITVMVFGHWMEMKSVSSAQNAVNQLAKLLPDTAELQASGETKIIPVSELNLGDLVLIRPGAKIPADCKVVEGNSTVNESMITGESEYVQKSPGSEIIAGTINGSGSLTAKVNRIGQDTALAGIMRLVAEAQASKSKAQLLADRAAFYLTIVAVMAGIATVISWIAAGESVGFALQRTVTVLIIACPHALGLAIPLVVAISTSLAARNGLLVRQRMALESARNIDVVLFDKTGTLTKGERGVTDIWTEGASEIDVLSAAGSAENKSEHVVARAIVNFAKERGAALRDVKDFAAIPGQGVRAMVDGEQVFAGGPNLLAANNFEISDGMAAKAEQASNQGKTAVYIMIKNKVVGILALADLVREESKQAVRGLQAQNIRVAMITGDSRKVAEYVAAELGIKEVFAEVLPGNKADKVKELQNDGSKVAMVGDGVNDAPALTQADIGIAIGAGTDVAIESAGIILAKNDPRDVLKVIKLSKASYSKMRQNLFWAAGYNIVAIPLASGLFGFILDPAIGALLMSASTIVVALNAQLLRRLRL
ncbi:heavy metal translocating P-type ATPase, partial [Patescibacteria group bacterium]|nr:heavy metal translocating P-type ATPase [Patescibacteria group bacterium]